MDCRASRARRKAAFARIVWAASVLVLLWRPDPGFAQARGMSFQQLPAEARAYIETVRQSCKELNDEFQLFDQMQGISVIDLAGDGSRDLMIDAEQLCNDRMSGANCTNRGCDLQIWKQIGQGSWRKVLDEHLYRKFISVSDNGRFRSMSISVYAGDPRCRPARGRQYSSGQSCDLTVQYRNGRWIWNKVR